MFWITVYLAVK